jgi:pfkB family carbohydrate kinase
MLGAERSRDAARDLAAANVVHAVDADLGGQRAQSGEVLGDRRRRAPRALELLAIGVYRIARQGLGPGTGPDERAEGAIDASVGTARQRRCLAGDAFTAGVLLGSHEARSLDEAVRLGNAWGAAAVSVDGSVPPPRATLLNV